MVPICTKTLLEYNVLCESRQAVGELVVNEMTVKSSSLNGDDRLMCAD